MGAHAIVIGIDHYTKHPEWNLTGATTDAVAFAQWVTTSGGVAPQDLTLLLSPLPATAPVLDCPNMGTADWQSIANTLDQYETKQKQATRRFWFYYAGHGLAAAGEGPSAGPLLVPADTDSLNQYLRRRPLGMEQFRLMMQDVDPREQFYFIDACRALGQQQDKRTLAPQIYWQPRAVDDDKLATQVVFFATTAGRAAHESRGAGIFSRVLLAGLKGLGPELERPADLAAAQQGKVSLHFNKLSEFVRKAAERALEEVPALDAEERKTSVPYATITRVTGDVEIVQFDAGSLPTVTVSTVVTPAAARKQACLAFVDWHQQKPHFRPRNDPRPVGPPVKAKETFVLHGGKHTVRVQTDGFESLYRELLVHEDKSFLLELQPAAAPTPIRPSGTAAPGTLTVESPDRLTLLTVLDGSGKVVAHNVGSLQGRFAPGPYLLRAELGGVPTKEETVVVVSRARKEVRIDIGDGAYVDLSENLGDIANAKFSSGLAYAAWAARWPEQHGFHRLRAEGVDPLPGLAEDGCAVQVLVGDALHDDTFLKECRVWFEDELPLTRLPAQPALQGALSAPPGPLRARVEMPGFVATTFALSLLPRLVTVLIVTREKNGSAEVQQHFNPIDPTQRVHPRFGRPRHDDVRIVEIGARALEHREPLADNEYDQLVRRKGSNPMFGLIAGYRMLGMNRANEFAGIPLRNMRAAFPGLPDVHVLAGLYEPKKRDAHFRRAMQAGTPIFAEGFWALFDWMTQRALKENKPAPVLRQELTAGMVWTSFVDAPPAAKAEQVRLVTSTGRTSLAQIGDDRSLTAAARSVGRIQVGDGPGIGTAFLVAPRLAVVPVHIAAECATRNAKGRWALTKPASIRFDLADPASTRKVVRVLRTVKPRKNTKVRSGSINPTMLEMCWPVLLVLDDDASVPPLALAKAASASGERVAVIGFPFDAGVAHAAFAEHFIGANGEKHVMPGVVLRPPGDTWTLDHNCFTAPGTSGGPIVNHSGQVIGMHVVGRISKEGFKQGTGVALTRFAAEDLKARWR